MSDGHLDNIGGRLQESLNAAEQSDGRMYCGRDNPLPGGDFRLFRKPAQESNVLRRFASACRKAPHTVASAAAPPRPAKLPSSLMCPRPATG